MDIIAIIIFIFAAKYIFRFMGAIIRATSKMQRRNSRAMEREISSAVNSFFR